RVWRRERDLTGWMSLSRKPEVTWYGWDGDRLTTVQTGTTRIQTVYQPGSFTPLIRIETENGEQAKARHRSLAEVLQEDTGVTLPAELAVMLGRLERELRAGAVSAESEAWLAQCGLTAEQMAAPVGVFGPGWKAPFDIRLQIRDEGLILNDSGGRSIHFEPLFPGEISYSRSESFWLARGGVATQHSSQPLSALWQVLPEDVRLSPYAYLAANSLQGPWWILSWPERVPGADEVLPPEPPAYRV
ncbi:DUF6531 domain-containing protein, partial [Escherichia coli]|uniref:DUF6531 domain-containing protein n=1 Tax=Escherichia coli TaxID=562 RepID=UPI0035B6A0C6